MLTEMPENKGRKRALSSEQIVLDSVEHLSKVRLPPPAVVTKPLTPFSIQDILKSKPSNQRHQHYFHHRSPFRAEKGPLPSTSDSVARLSNRTVSGEEGATVGGANLPNTNPHNPINALEELTQETFKGLEENIIKTAEAANDGKRSHLGLFSHRQPPRRKRKSRTAFSNHQLFELERRFLYQKYLSPGDRDEIASSLGLTSSQVITWFQNRRAKLKRDMEEMKNDITAAEQLTCPKSLADIPESELSSKRTESTDTSGEESL
ncbi:transcription factor LBX2-like isoform X2 [Ptychodera flava]|uniref:transcription factor LBX2-like isoform X2 n=1 Tax=Ptychodera flava TaxID=63121 RepID=UPI00396A46ED